MLDCSLYTLCFLLSDTGCTVPDLTMANDVKDPAWLRRSELQYELERRKIEAKGTVREMVELLRQHSRDPTHKITEPQQVSLAASAIIAALEEMIEVIQGESSPTVSQIRRLQARFNHYVDRRSDLVGVDEDREQQLTSYIETIRDWLQTYSSNNEVVGSDERTVVSTRERTTPVDAVFSKLQNPLQESLNRCAELSLNSVEDMVRVLEFSVDFQHKTSVLQISCTDALKLMAMYVKDRLREEVEQAIQQGCIWKQFRRQICSLIPERVLHEMVYSQYWQQQAVNETVVGYVLRVKQSVRVFELEYAEEQVVRHILKGFNTATRQRAVFGQIPSTFRELETMVNYIQETEILDERRAANVSITEKGEQLQKGVPSLAGNSRERVMIKGTTINRGERRRQITCWNCGKAGHVRSQCSEAKCQQQQL